MRIAVVGRPGSGKSTQARRLAEVLRMPVVRPADTPVDRAPVWPGSRTRSARATAMEIADLLGGMAPTGAVVDGVPTTMAQVHALQEARVLPELVVRLVTPRVLSFSRITAGLTCPGCTAPDVAVSTGLAVCDACLPAARRPAGETASSIERRLAEHEANIAPVLEWFTSRGRLVLVDGVGPARLVACRTARALRRRAELLACS